MQSAVQLVENMRQFFSQSQVDSESRSNSKARGPQDNRETREGRESRDQSKSRNVATTTAPRDRSQSTRSRSAMPRDSEGTPNGRDATNDRGLADERINRFLESMAQQAAQTAESEVLQENRSLYQRIAALQRTERELLAENQDLTRKLAAMKQHHERRARKWNEESRRIELEYETRMRELGEQLLELMSRHPQNFPGILSNEEIRTWFDGQDAAWHCWATSFGHQDDQRLCSGLHPLQLQELCGDVGEFVRMTDAGGLPRELLAGGKEALHTLLNGILAHFLCDEILASPMWVFVATSLGALESPGIVSSQPSIEPPAVGFQGGMNRFSNVMSLRPGPSQLETPRSPRFPPSLLTSMIPLLGTSSASVLGIPMKPEMERLVYMITDGKLKPHQLQRCYWSLTNVPNEQTAQDDGMRVTAYHWRAQMMRLFADGGFGLKDVAAAGRTESCRIFIDSRLTYARKLKERFLGGSARFLLQDQDASGIEKLERSLTDIIDEALRFSCRLWSRVAPIRLHGWSDLGSRDIRAATPVVTLCRAQVEVEACSKDKSSGTPQDNQTDRQIVMVVQPAIVADSIDLPGVNDVETGGDGIASVWLRARVMVAGPMSVDEPECHPAGEGWVPDLSQTGG